MARGEPQNDASHARLHVVITFPTVVSKAGALAQTSLKERRVGGADFGFVQTLDRAGADLRQILVDHGLRAGTVLSHDARSLQGAQERRTISSRQLQARRTDESRGQCRLRSAMRAERVVAAALHPALSVAFTLTVAQKHDVHRGAAEFDRIRGRRPQCT